MRQLLRRLLRAPGFALASVAVLGGGIGIGVAALAVAQRAFLEPLPYTRSDRLAVLLEATPTGGNRLASYPTVQDWVAQSRSFTSISYVTGTQLLFRQPSGPEQVVVAYPSDPFFELMNGRPLLGRTFAAGESPTEPIVVLSHALWKNQFGGRRDIVGAHVPLGDGGATVIGVMPAGFAFPEWAQAWMPLGMAPPSLQVALRQRGNHADSRVIARLRDGTNPSQALAELNAIAARLAQAYPEESREWTRVSLVPMRDYVTSFTLGGAGQELTPRIALFAGAAVLILVLGCANIAVLGLVRNINRSRELAVRAALGASRGMILRHVLAESLTLSLCGGVLGCALGFGIVRVIQRENPELFPRLSEIEFSGVFVVGALLLSVAAGLLAGLIPAIRATPGATIPLVGGTRGLVGTGRGAGRLQRFLIAGQVAIAVTLMVGAGLLLNSLRYVINTTVGFDPRGLSVIRVNPSLQKYASPDRMLVLYQSLMGAVQQLPGVQSVAFTNHAPLSGTSIPTRVTAPGRETSESTPDQANFKTISTNYFVTVGIPVLRGRVFTDADLAAPNGTLVINEKLAHKLWPNQDPVGKPITVYKSSRWLPDFGEAISGTVIGVVGDVRHFGQDADPTEEVYVPYTWNPWSWGSLVVRARSTGGPNQTQIRQAILAIDPDLPLGGANAYASFSRRLSELRAPRLLLTSGLGLLSIAALGITMIGLYGSLAFTVRARWSELGLRLALGARRGQVLGEIARDGLRTTGVGLVVGLVAAWLMATLLKSLVFGISPRDPVTFLLASAPLVVIAILAIYIPARHATKVDPAQALRG